MQSYETPTMTSEMHSFIPSGIELLAFSSKNQFLDHNSEAEASSRPSVIGTSYQGLGNPGGNLGNWKSFNVPQNRSNTVWAAPSIVVPNNMQQQQQQHHGGLVSYSGQVIPNPIVVARGGSMQVGSSGDIRKGDMEVASQNPHHQTDHGTHLFLMNPKYPNEFPEGTSTAAANMTEIRPTNGLNPPGFEAQKNILEFPHFPTQIPTIISEASPSLRDPSHGTGSDLPGSGNMQHSQLMLAQFNNTLNWANRYSGSQPWNREQFIENKVDESFRSEYSSKGQDGSGQRLSLSLSSHQPSEMHLQDIANQTNVLQFGGDAKSKLGDLFNSAHGTTTDGLAYNISSYSRNGIPGKGFMDSIQGGGRSAILQYMKDGSTGAFAGYGLGLKNSRYLKAAQEILYEFCNVGRGIETKTSPKQKLSMEVNVIPGSSSSRSHEFGAKTETGMMNQPFYPGDRFELQRRKAKLVSMLDEVDRRYRNYCDQMQLVVSSFESASTLGAAAPYTALALKAMSRHFRCLKDAVTGQLQVTIKALGEKGSVVPGTSRGETPRLGFLERSIRQQRAFHHLGLMEQHPWRPQRGLPERSVSVLRAWLFEHFLHPYPTDADKHILAKQTGLTRSQVSNWFINARVRLWKPMVEEMYIEETKEEKVDQVGQNAEAEAERSTGTNNDENTMFNSGGADNKCTANSEEAAFKLDHSSSTTSQTGQADIISSGNVTLHLQSKDPEMAVARETSESLSSMNTSHEGDMKLDAAPGYNIFEQDKGFRNDLYASKFQTAGHTGMSVDFSSYNNTTTSTTVAEYSHGDLTPRQFANSGVSLTLGLRHSGGLSYNPLNEQKYDNNIYFSRVQDDADPGSQYSMLDNEVSPGNGFMQEQDIEYRNYIVNGSRLLHDFVG